ncbi:MAG: hypothetical protein V4504_00375 [Patescibacteria group bacterium]
MKLINKIIICIVLIGFVSSLSFLSLRTKKNEPTLSDHFSFYEGYLTKINDNIIFRNCKGDISYHTLIPTENIDKKLVITRPTYVNIQANISNTISLIKEIQISKEEECQGDTNPVYLANIFTALKEVSEDQTLIEDGTNFESSEKGVPSCAECLIYTYEFDHYGVPGLHYKSELLIKNGLVIKRHNS